MSRGLEQCNDCPLLNAQAELVAKTAALEQAEKHIAELEQELQVLMNVRGHLELRIAQLLHGIEPTRMSASEPDAAGGEA